MVGRSMLLRRSERADRCSVEAFGRAGFTQWQRRWLGSLVIGRDGVHYIGNAGYLTCDRHPLREHLATRDVCLRLAPQGILGPASDNKRGRDGGGLTEPRRRAVRGGCLPQLRLAGCRCGTAHLRGPSGGGHRGLVRPERAARRRLVGKGQPTYLMVHLVVQV
jgi:hypothetical protein